MKGITLFASLVFCKNERKSENVGIEIPVFEDKNSVYEEKGVQNTVFMLKCVRSATTDPLKIIVFLRYPLLSGKKGK